MAHHDDSANDDNAVDRICTRHQGRVQNGRHIGNHLNTQKDGQDDDIDKRLIFKKESTHGNDK